MTALEPSSYRNGKFIDLISLCDMFQKTFFLGHSNTFLYNLPTFYHVDQIQFITERIIGPYPVMVTQSNGKSVPVVQAYKHTKYLGHLNLTFNDNDTLKESNGNPIILKQELPQGKHFQQTKIKYLGLSGHRVLQELIESLIFPFILCTKLVL